MPVDYSRQAEDDLEVLAPTILERVLSVIDRLESWPQVSGVKWLQGDWKNHARIRTGDYRIVFHVVGDVVIIDRIAHRRDAYAE